jgi:hypothetical protein
MNIANAFVEIGTKGLAQTKAAITGLGATLQTAFGPLTVLLAGAFALKEMITGFNEAQAADTKLNSALKASGAEVENNSKRLSELALSLRSISTHSDDALKEAMALGIQMGIGADKIGEYTTAAVGLARALGISVEDAMSNLAREANGMPTRLNKTIPALDGVTNASERLAIISKFAAGGLEQEQAQAATLAGRMKQLWEVLGDFGDIVMGVLGPALTWAAEKLLGMARVAQAVFTAIGEVAAPYIQKAADFLSYLGEQAGIAADTLFSTMMPALQFLEQYLLAVADGIQWLVTQAMNMGGAFVGWIEQITGIEISWENMRAMAGDAMNWIRNSIAEVIFRIYEWQTSAQIAALNIQRVFAVAANWILDQFEAATKGVAYFFDHFGEIAQTVLDYVTKLFWQWVEQQKAAFKAVWDYVSSLGQVDVQANFDNVLTKGQNVIDTLAKGFVDMIDVGAIDKKLEGLNSELENKRPKYQEDLAAFESKARGAISSIGGKIAELMNPTKNKPTIGTLGLTGKGAGKDTKAANEGVGQMSGLVEAYKRINSAAVKSQAEKLAAATNEKLGAANVHLAQIAKNTGAKKLAPVLGP